IRELMAELPESRARGYTPGRFSFNTKGGRCEACEGDGVRKVEMHFLADVYVTCDECQGKRFNQATLEVRYRGKNIADILGLTVSEARELFAAHADIHAALLLLEEVGVGYLQVGQPSPTLSGGEAQRIKLARELSKRATGDTLYILDEPTTGLHFADVKKLLEVLHRLVDAGNTVVVIEHNLDVIKTADFVLDLGPGGGPAGGELVARGTPEEIAANPASATGKYLARILGARRSRPALRPATVPPPAKSPATAGKAAGKKSPAKAGAAQSKALEPKGRPKNAPRSSARQGKTVGARGKARPGKARPGKARPGKARPGKARPGKARPGKARPGKAPSSRLSSRA